MFYFISKRYSYNWNFVKENRIRILENRIVIGVVWDSKTNRRLLEEIWDPNFVLTIICVNVQFKSSTHHDYWLHWLFVYCAAYKHWLYWMTVMTFGIPILSLSGLNTDFSWHRWIRISWNPVLWISLASLKFDQILECMESCTSM